MTNQYKLLGLTTEDGKKFLKDFIQENGFELAGMVEINHDNLNAILENNSDAIIMYTNQFDDVEQDLVKKILEAKKETKIILITKSRSVSAHNRAIRTGVTKVLLNDKGKKELAHLLEEILEETINNANTVSDKQADEKSVNKKTEKQDSEKQGSKKDIGKKSEKPEAEEDIDKESEKPDAKKDVGSKNDENDSRRNTGKNMNKKSSSQNSEKDTNSSENDNVNVYGVPPVDETKKHRVISVFGTKGGTGKSTVSVNLATALQKKGNSVAIIDLDLQFGDVSVFMNISNVKTISDLVREGDFSYKKIKSYFYQHSTGISVLPAPESPELAEIVKPEHLNKIVDAVKGQFDYIFFDMSPTIDDYVLQMLDISDTIYFVTNPEISTLRNTKVCLNVLNTLGHSGKIKIILNKDGKSHVKKSDVEDVLGKAMTLVIPTDTKNAISAINRGIPIIESSPRSKISKTIIKYITNEEI